MLVIIVTINNNSLLSTYHGLSFFTWFSSFNPYSVSLRELFYYPQTTRGETEFWGGSVTYPTSHISMVSEFRFVWSQSILSQSRCIWSQSILSSPPALTVLLVFIILVIRVIHISKMCMAIDFIHLNISRPNRLTLELKWTRMIT